jgi:hypothetical protein
MTINQHIAAARVSSQHVSSRAVEDQQMDDGEPSDLDLPDEFLAPPTPFRTRASLSTAPLAANMSNSLSTAPLAANMSSRRSTAPLSTNMSSSRNSTAPLAADVSRSRNTAAPLAANVSSSRNAAPLAANMSRNQNVSSRRSGATSTDFSGSQRYLYQFTSFLKLKCAMADVPVGPFVRFFVILVFVGLAEGSGFLNEIFLNFYCFFPLLGDGFAVDIGRRVAKLIARLHVGSVPTWEEFCLLKKFFFLPFPNRSVLSFMKPFLYTARRR